MDPDARIASRLSPDGRSSQPLSSAYRIAGIGPEAGKQLHSRYPDIATSSYQFASGKMTKRMFDSESARLFIAARANRLGVAWPVAFHIAALSFRALASYALQGVTAPGSLYFGIRPRTDDDPRPLVFGMPPSADAERAAADGYREDGVLAIVVPTREMLTEYCARASVELGVEITPQHVLACFIAGTPEAGTVENA
jgi:hypothetical protein